MWFNTLLCLYVLVLPAIAYSTKDIVSNEYSQKSQNVVVVPPSTRNELPCIAIGGNCLGVDICPQERRSLVKGLCPAQEKQGVECCDLRSVTGKVCSDRGGKCVPRYADCEEKITFFEGGDCSINEKCC